MTVLGLIRVLVFIVPFSIVFSGLMCFWSSDNIMNYCYLYPSTTQIELYGQLNLSHKHQTANFTVAPQFIGVTATVNPFGETSCFGLLVIAEFSPVRFIQPSEEFVLVISNSSDLENLTQMMQSDVKKSPMAVIMLTNEEMWNTSKFDRRFGSLAVPITILEKNQSQLFQSVLQSTDVTRVNVSATPKYRSTACHNVGVTLMLLSTFVILGADLLWFFYVLEETEFCQNLAETITRLRTKMVLAHQPVRVVGDPNGEECAICREDFARGDRVRLLVRCKHEFHTACVDPWIEVQGILECPFCRQKL